ncbi:MAG: peptide chain release factor 1 [Firmicutes bacterium]|nr:peptide chain release factor 1 [Bacillota bacterium]
MLEKLAEVEVRYKELSHLMADPDIIANQTEWQKHAKEHAALQEIVNTFRLYKDVLAELEDNQELLGDELEPEFRQLVEEELEDLLERKERLEEELQLLLLPQDPNDEKNVIVEIRSGAGGDEAALFAGDLYRMYSRYAESRRWKTDVIEAHPTDIGGFKEIIFVLEGKGAYSRLKYESGVHRVQRIPTTESGGRIHTSTVTVAVLPEAEEVEVEINPNELRIDTFCSSGPGGQSVNTTYSAVRITHLPTGLVVSCQDEKSQHKNRDKAMRVLRARLFDKALEDQRAEVDEARRDQVGTGDRSERIRTYNFPQGRVTDHRVGLTLHKLDQVLNGSLDELIDALIMDDQAERLKVG